ncbi:MAG: folate-binding protein YgfZ [Alphaproteobacteria bacterium]|nr:folate-binding protein YgfZ [Alphaproteobacteria bacterium]
MATAQYYQFNDRACLTIGGEDRTSFLQGLVSNDVTKVSAARAGYGAFLTPQGKFLHDFFLAEIGGGFVLDTEAERIDEFFRKLRLYKLRAKVDLALAGEAWQSLAVFGEGALERLKVPAERGAAIPFHGGVAFVDPRHVEIGARLLLPVAAGTEPLDALGLTPADRAAYDRRRVTLGLPDGARDMAVEKTVLLEAGFEELGGVDFDKGCYMGQELTARTKYRGLVKRRLMPITLHGPLPAPGTEITLNGKEAGEIRSVVADGNDHAIGLAMIRLNRLDEALQAGIPLIAGEATVIPSKPDWAKF